MQGRQLIGNLETTNTQLMRSTGTTKGATRGPHGAMKGRQLIRNLETTNTKLMRNTGTMKGATRGQHGAMKGVDLPLITSNTDFGSAKLLLI